MDRIDRTLSRRAQEFWTTALVICRNEGTGLERWLLHSREHNGVHLGDSADEARHALQGLVDGTVMG